MLKLDFGFILVYLLTSYLFNYSYWYFMIFDTLTGIILLVNIYIMRIALRKEEKNKVLLVLLTRILLEGYKIYRVIWFIFIEKYFNGRAIDFKGPILVIAGVCNIYLI